MAVKQGPKKGVDADLGGLAGPEGIQLGLLEVGHHPRVERHQAHQLLTGLNLAARLGAERADATSARRMDALIVQLQLGAGRGRLRLADARLGGGGLLPFHTHLALAGASLEGRALAAGELTKGLPIGGPGPIHLLARHAPLGHQELQAPQI